MRSFYQKIQNFKMGTKFSKLEVTFFENSTTIEQQYEQERMNELTDAELVAATLNGHKSAFGILIERYQEMAQQVARRTIAGSFLADDLAQEALLQAYLSLDRLRDASRFRSWLYGIVLNVCRSYLRDQHIDHTSLEALLGGLHHPIDPTPEEVVESIEIRHLMNTAIQRLSPANREAIILFYYEDFSLREGAEILGISTNALKARLHKARHQLQHHFKTLSHRETQRKEKTMIPVQVVDVIRQEAPIADNVQPLIHMKVVLYDAQHHRALLIWVGEYEGLEIMRQLTRTETPRPMTTAFMARLLQASGATLDRVEISLVNEKVFYASAKLRRDDLEQDVDARSSDAIALALEMNAPIYVSAEVFEKLGMTIPADLAPKGGGLSSIAAWWAAQQTIVDAHFQKIATKSDAEQAADFEADRLRTLEVAFGKSGN